MTGLLDARFAGNAYAAEIEAALPRVLALTDVDPLSPTLGVGDRQFWAWKLIDFANGTLQGPVNGLSTLLEIGAFGPAIDPRRVRARILEMLAATTRLMRGDGSFEEALPFEQSYCVTALALYDHLRAVERVPEVAGRSIALGPAARFLTRREETHGFISNHLATAAAALLRWDRLARDPAARRKAEALIDRILDRQSDEGWFEEYGGADPGYQTLCMTHLADAAFFLDAPRLWSALGRGVDFLRRFAHPDGSFGGVYGSRATRVYYPAAMEILGERFANARALADWMRPAIRGRATVTPSAVDAPNLSPVFNNYCQALAAHSEADREGPPNPAPRGRLHMPHAGLIVDVGPAHHTVVSTRKSVVCHWRGRRVTVDDAGLVVKDARGRFLTSQGAPDATAEIDGDRVILSGTLTARAIPTPNPYNFLVLRLLSLSIMRVPALGALVKRAIARLLVGARGGTGGRFRRDIRLGENLVVVDDWEPRGLRRVETNGPFSVIHMASSGYWQRGDTEELSR